MFKSINTQLSKAANEDKEKSEAILALEKARRLEKKRLKQGYRWVKVGLRNKILVQCDKDGNPTPSECLKIENLKKQLGVV